MTKNRKKQLTKTERDHLQKQAAQISAFLDNCYDGMCHDVAIIWTIRDGFNPVKGTEYKSYNLDDYLSRKGDHTKIEIGYGDAYYGSSSLGRMLHEAAYEWREKILVRLADDQSEPSFADLCETS